jgi:hypothetical protein
LKGWCGGSEGRGAAQPVHAADRLIEDFIVANLGFVSYQFLSSVLYHPAAADAPSVSTPSKHSQIALCCGKIACVVNSSYPTGID